MATLEIMVLPPIENGRPQFLLNDDGMWRDLTPTPDALDREAFRKSVETFLQSAMTSVSQGNAINAQAPGFRRECKRFFTELLPSDLQKAVNNLADGGFLRIYLHRSAEWVPWELLHDANDYLGLRLHVVRLPLMSRTEHIRGVQNKDVRHVYNLLGRDILPDALLPNWAQTFAAFANGGGNWETRCPTGAAQATFASWDELSAAGTSAADIIHVTCHGGLRDDERSPYYWSLDLHGVAWNYRIAIDDLRDFALSGKPLVFGNACASAGGGGAGSIGGLHGLGAAFMMSGALNFIGTFAPITQQTSVGFATTFYSNLLAAAPPLTIAEALLQTKKSNANPTDPSYLFYCLYGPPDIQYKPVH